MVFSASLYFKSVVLFYAFDYDSAAPVFPPYMHVLRWVPGLTVIFYFTQTWGTCANRVDAAVKGREARI